MLACLRRWQGLRQVSRNRREDHVPVFATIGRAQQCARCTGNPTIFFAGAEPLISVAAIAATCGFHVLPPSLECAMAPCSPIAKYCFRFGQSCPMAPVPEWTSHSGHRWQIGLFFLGRRRSFNRLCVHYGSRPVTAACCEADGGGQAEAGAKRQERRAAAVAAPLGLKPEATDVVLHRVHSAANPLRLICRRHQNSSSWPNFSTVDRRNTPTGLCRVCVPTDHRSGQLRGRSRFLSAFESLGGSALPRKLSSWSSKTRERFACCLLPGYFCGQIVILLFRRRLRRSFGAAGGT